MTLSMTCQCGKRLRLGDHLAGKRVKCPSCGLVQAAPASAAPATAPGPAADPPPAKRPPGEAPPAPVPRPRQDADSRTKRPPEQRRGALAPQKGDGSAKATVNPAIWVVPLILVLVFGGFGLLGVLSPSRNAESDQINALFGMAGMAVLFVAVYAAWSCSTNFSYVAGFVGIFAFLPLLAVAVALGWLGMTVLGPAGGALYGALLGVAVWGTQWWIRGWSFWPRSCWQGLSGAWAAFLARMNKEGYVSLQGTQLAALFEVLVHGAAASKEDDEGDSSSKGTTALLPWPQWREVYPRLWPTLQKEVLGDELVTYVTPGKGRFGGALQVTPHHLYFLFRVAAIGKLAQLGEGDVMTNTAGQFPGVPPETVMYGRRKGEVVFVFKIRTGDITDVRAVHRGLGHHVVVRTGDGADHRFKYGIFPATRLLNALERARAEAVAGADS